MTFHTQMLSPMVAVLEVTLNTILGGLSTFQHGYSFKASSLSIDLTAVMVSVRCTSRCSGKDRVLDLLVVT